MSKAKDSLKYRGVEPEEFDYRLDNILEVQDAVFTLAAKLGDKEGSLAFKDEDGSTVTDGNGNVITFTRNDLQTAKKYVKSKLEELKKYYGGARKRAPGAKQDPSSLKGSYIRVVAGPALKQFFNSITLGYVDPTDDKSGLVEDSLPTLKRGYFLQNSANMLWHIFLTANELHEADKRNFAHPDEGGALVAAFGADEPALYFSERVGETQKKIKKRTEGGPTHKTKGKFEKRLMTNEDGPLNTFDMIAQNDKRFNPERFNTFYGQNIVALNSTNIKHLEDGDADKVELEKPAVIKAMIDEHNLLKQVSEEWAKLRPAPVKKPSSGKKVKAKRELNVAMLDE